MTSKKQLKRRLERRLQLDVDLDIKEILRELSAEIGVSQSQLVSYFVLCGTNDVASAMSNLPKYLEPSDAPMWKYRINFDHLKRDLGI